MQWRVSARDIMIKDIREVKEKYDALRRNAEYVDIGQVINDLYQLMQTARLKRIPKKER
jgi:hypothetical protein